MSWRVQVRVRLRTGESFAADGAGADDAEAMNAAQRRLGEQDERLLGGWDKSDVARLVIVMVQQ